jgi:hypothetical protein
MDRDATPLTLGDPIAQMRTLLDNLGEPHPAFELGLRWLERTRPDEREPVVVHGDFRLGNLLVDPTGITAVLDWEIPHLGSGIEDLGWFCHRAWRFGSPLRAGGVGTAEELVAGYAEAGGVPPTPAELDWWEAYGCLRWGLICVLQASIHLDGFQRSVELAAIGRRASEAEEDLLLLLAGPSDYEPPSADDVPLDLRTGPHDRPTAAELLEAVVEHLDGLRAEQGGRTAFHLRVTGNVVAMLGREVALAPQLAELQLERLDSLGVADDAELAEAIREGRMDDRLDEVTQAVRAMVRDKLAVSHPGWWHGDGESVAGAQGTPAGGR